MLASLIRSGLFCRAETGEFHGLHTVVGVYSDGSLSAPWPSMPTPGGPRRRAPRQPARQVRAAGRVQLTPDCPIPPLVLMTLDAARRHARDRRRAVFCRRPGARRPADLEAVSGSIRSRHRRVAVEPHDVARRDGPGGERCGADVPYLSDAPNRWRNSWASVDRVGVGRADERLGERPTRGRSRGPGRRREAGIGRPGTAIERPAAEEVDEPDGRCRSAPGSTRAIRSARSANPSAGRRPAGAGDPADVGVGLVDDVSYGSRIRPARPSPAPGRRPTK